jgi:hypothetical protein
MQTTTQQKHAKRNILLPCALLGPLLLFAGGCGGAIVGDWHMVKATPNREMFAIDDAHFARDGSFTATVTIEGKTVHEQGEYEFNGFKLTMRPRGGGQRRYNAMKTGRTLKVQDGDRHVFLKKGSKSSEK